MRNLTLWMIIFLALTLTSCARLTSAIPALTEQDPDSSPVTATHAQTETSPQRTLVVFAAASLTGAFQELGQDFESANPGVAVQFNFAGSQILRAQMEQGAVADIYAPADLNNMSLLIQESLVPKNTDQIFATNRLVVILPVANPGKILTLDDLAKPGLKLVLADSSVPAGRYARQVLTRLSQNPTYGAGFPDKVLSNVVSNETDVKQVVTKVELGEADAGVVYVSDAIASGDLLTIPIPDRFNITASYPIAVLSGAPEPKLATAFINYILSPAGQQILTQWGFELVIP